MALTNRKNHKIDVSTEAAVSTSSLMTTSKPRSHRLVLKKTFSLIFVTLAVIALAFTQVGDKKKWTTIPGVGIQFELTGPMDGTSNGKYSQLEIKTQCPKAEVYAFITGDALVDIPLMGKNAALWIGSVSFPLDGNYKLKIKGVGCNEGKQFEFYSDSFAGKRDVTIEEKSNLYMDKMISKGSWIASKRLNIGSQDSKEIPDYVWMNPSIINDDKQIASLEGGGNGFVVKEGSVIPGDEFYEFEKLSNYELVCFFGSKSASELHRSLLSLRRVLFPHQRPFKFHIYEANSFTNPDITWTDDKKKGFRKCKHILVSMDEPETSISQIEYKNQMTSLIKHLTNAFDDETFPIWIFTTMEQAMGTKNCHSPLGQRSTEHPCNVALREIFKSSGFSSRVRLLDNTHLSNPQQDGFYEDILAAVALRIFIIVGNQVKVWRAHKQVGHVKGLTRGEKEYGNFELVPYDFSQKVE